MVESSPEESTTVSFGKWLFDKYGRWIFDKEPAPPWVWFLFGAVTVITQEAHGNPWGVLFFMWGVVVLPR